MVKDEIISKTRHLIVWRKIDGHYLLMREEGISLKKELMEICLNGETQTLPISKIQWLKEGDE